jgi:DNA (cytosine-5)-methyltransferase 1
MKVNNGMDNLKRNDEGLRELALFAGAGGGILGGLLLGWRTVCAVEYNAYARSVLLARQNDRTLPPFPIWDDVRTFDGTAWRGRVDVVSGGFPCTDISCAGKGAGIEGEQSGLWKQMARVIREIRPQYVFIENSPMLATRGLGSVLGDLASMGFNAEWGLLSAADLNAPHIRDRIWILAYPGEVRRHSGGLVQNIDRTQGTGSNTSKRCEDWVGTEIFQKNGTAFSEWLPEPEPNGMADELAVQLERLKAIGNGQVPRVAATAWKILSYW